MMWRALARGGGEGSRTPQGPTRHGASMHRRRLSRCRARASRPGCKAQTTTPAPSEARPQRSRKAANISRPSLRRWPRGRPRPARARRTPRGSRTSSVPVVASTRTRSPCGASRSAPRRRLRGHVDRGGDLPLAPDMRPSVTRATFRPRDSRTDSVGSAREARACRWRADPGTDDDHGVFGERARPERRLHVFLFVKHTHRGLDDPVLGSDAETFITDRPRLPLSSFSPPVFWNGSEAGAGCGR